MIPLREFVLLALAVAALSFTLTRSTMPLIVPLREWASRWPWSHELLHCPYCMSHWIGLLAMLIYQPMVIHSSYVALDWIVSWLALVGAAMGPIFAVLLIARS